MKVFNFVNETKCSLLPHVDSILYLARKCTEFFREHYLLREADSAQAQISMHILNPSEGYRIVIILQLFFTESCAEKKNLYGVGC